MLIERVVGCSCEMSASANNQIRNTDHSDNGEFEIAIDMNLIGRLCLNANEIGLQEAMGAILTRRQRRHRRSI